MTDNHDRAIGRIEGKLDRLIEDHARATEKRGEMYRRIESSERKMDDVIKRLEKVEHPVAEFSKWRERAIGATMFISLASALLGSAISTYWQKILLLFKGG